MAEKPPFSFKFNPTGPGPGGFTQTQHFPDNAFNPARPVDPYFLSGGAPSFMQHENSPVYGNQNQSRFNSGPYGFNSASNNASNNYSNQMNFGRPTQPYPDSTDFFRQGGATPQPPPRDFDPSFGYDDMGISNPYLHGGRTGTAASPLNLPMLPGIGSSNGPRGGTAWSQRLNNGSSAGSETNSASGSSVMNFDTELDTIKGGFADNDFRNSNLGDIDRNLGIENAENTLGGPISVTAKKRNPKPSQESSGLLNWDAAAGSVDPKTGVYRPGWGMSAIDTAMGVVDTYMGFKKFGLAEDQLKQQKNEFALNFGASTQAYNTELSDSYNAAYNSSGGRGPTPEQYVADNRINNTA